MNEKLVILLYLLLLGSIFSIPYVYEKGWEDAETNMINICNTENSFYSKIDGRRYTCALESKE